jgi:molybdate transport system substrate-binding protein
VKESRAQGRRSWLASLGVLVLGCQQPAAPSPGSLVIFAASSLRDAFGSLKAEFVKVNPQVEITFNFAGTQELRTQLEHGAPVDVFASADQKHMAALLQASRVSKPAVFARNEPVIVVAREQQGKVSGLGDLPSWSAWWSERRRCRSGATRRSS